MAHDPFISRLTTSIRKKINLWHCRHIPILGGEIGDFTALLKSGSPFSFARYGDGEWAAILGCKGANCDGHPYTDELGKRLRKAVSNDLPYFHGLQRTAMKSDGKAIADYLSKNNISRTWKDADIFHDASRDGRLFPFVKELRKKPVVVIGPSRLRALGNVAFPIVDFIEIPSQNCFDSVEEVLQAIRHRAESGEPALYAFSASMMTKVLIDELYPALGKKNWMIDFGSMWDIYTGVPSRGYMTSRNWDVIIKRNLGI